MAGFKADIVFTDAVKGEQTRRGSREGYRRNLEKRDWSDDVTEELAQFIAIRESLYLATANA